MTDSTTPERLAQSGLVARAFGNAGAPLVICLHGFPDIADAFDGLALELAAAGYYVVAPYLRGYGPSTGEGSVLLEQLVADVVGWKEHLSPEGKVALIGHDWGAAITYQALATQSAHFVGGVCMSLPHPLGFFAHGLRHRSQAWKSRYILRFQLPAASDAPVRADGFRYIDELYYRWSPGLAALPERHKKLKQSLAAHWPKPLEYYRGMIRPLGPALTRIAQGARGQAHVHLPLLSLHGEQDGCIEAEAYTLQTRFVRGQQEHRLIRGGGHFLLDDSPEPVRSACLDFLGRYYSPSG